MPVAAADGAAVDRHAAILQKDPVVSNCIGDCPDNKMATPLQGAGLAGESEGEFRLMVAQVGEALFPVSTGVANGDVLPWLPLVVGASEVGVFPGGHDGLLRETGVLFKDGESFRRHPCHIDIPRMTE